LNLSTVCSDRIDQKNIEAACCGEAGLDEQIWRTVTQGKIYAA
jgi:hypothetical protein